MRRVSVALQVTGGLLVVAAIVRYVQTMGFIHRFAVSGEYVLVVYRSPEIMAVCGIGLLVLSLIVPRIRR